MSKRLSDLLLHKEYSRQMRPLYVPSETRTTRHVCEDEPVYSKNMRLNRRFEHAPPHRPVVAAEQPAQNHRAGVRVCPCVVVCL